MSNNYEDVIRAGDSNLEVLLFWPVNMLIILGMVAFSIFFIAFLIDALRDWKKFLRDGGLRGLIGFGIGLVVSISLGFLVVGEEDRVAEWRSEDVAKFMDELPIERSEVVDMRMDDLFWGTYNEIQYLEDVDRQDFVKLKLSINVDDRMVQISDRFDTRLTLDSGSVPYLEYKNVEKDLGNGVYAGYYDAVLYVPKDYKFKDPN